MEMEGVGLVEQAIDQFDGKIREIARLIEGLGENGNGPVFLAGAEHLRGVVVDTEIDELEPAHVADALEHFRYATGQTLEWLGSESPAWMTIQDQVGEVGHLVQELVAARHEAETTAIVIEQVCRIVDRGGLLL